MTNSTRQQVLELYQQGLGFNQIASMLQISVKDVRSAIDGSRKQVSQ